METLLIVSDLHCGSTRALLPPGLLDEDGREMRLHKVQDWLWARWTEFCEWAHRESGGEYDMVVLGDAIEGVHHRGGQVVSTDTGIHTAIAEHTLAPLTEHASQVWMVRGTEAHVGRSAEAGLALAIGGEKNRDEDTYSFDRLNLSVNGCNVTLAHHFPASTRIALYATQLGVQLAEAQAQAARHGEEIPHVVVGAHRHTHGIYTDSRGMAITTPPWQLLTRFGYKVVPYATPTVGGVLLDWRGLPPGSLPRVHSWLRSAALPTSFVLGTSLNSSRTKTPSKQSSRNSGTNGSRRRASPRASA